MAVPLLLLKRLHKVHLERRKTHTFNLISHFLLHKHVIAKKHCKKFCDETPTSLVTMSLESGASILEALNFATKRR